MVDHTFLFTGAVKRIKEFIDDGALGKLYYYDSMRVNLGLFQHDVNVVWDLAPHDFAIMDYVIPEKPLALSATGEIHYNGFEDIAYVTVYCENNVIAHFNVNWLSPVKVRTTLIGGDKKMLVWNDLEPDEKLKVYDKGVDVKTRENVYDLLVSYRSGDAWVPRVNQIEALKAEAEYFVDCITNDKTPMNDGQAGLRVVKLLEAANASIKAKGRLIEL
jgi:predicted dehydrogenase